MSTDETKNTGGREGHGNACCDHEQFSMMFEKMSRCCSGKGELSGCAGMMNRMMGGGFAEQPGKKGRQKNDSRRAGSS